MSVTYDQFIADPLFAQFSDRDPNVVASLLSYAERRTPVVVWRDLQSTGIKFLTAHFLKTLKPGEEGEGTAEPQVSSISASQGSQSLSFASLSSGNMDDQLMTTWYGEQWLQMRRGLAVSGFVV